MWEGVKLVPVEILFWISILGASLLSPKRWVRKFILMTFLFGSLVRLGHGKGCCEALFCSGISCFALCVIPAFAEPDYVFKDSVALRLACFGARKGKDWANVCMFSSGFCVHKMLEVMFLLLLGAGNLVCTNDTKWSFLTWIILGEAGAALFRFWVMKLSPLPELLYLRYLLCHFCILTEFGQEWVYKYFKWLFFANCSPLSGA